MPLPGEEILPPDEPSGSVAPGENDKLADNGEQLVRGGAGFELVTVAEGLDQGTGFAFAPPNRIYVVEKRGVVRVIKDGRLLPRPFLDISAEVNSAQDRGMLGIAVDPAFPARPYLYIVYTVDPPEVFTSTPGPENHAAADGNGARASRLVRVEADPSTDFDTVLPGSTTILVGSNSTLENLSGLDLRNSYERPTCGDHGAYVRDCLPADENSHSIGTVLFGPDGMLYMGHGDGCDFLNSRPACTRALDVDSLAGKILRVDPATGKGLPDNPFYDGDPDSNRSKVYQLGLRNPFRFSFDPPTGSLYIGDVGWNVWEEINRGGPGANFGWPCFEGGNGNSLDQPGYQEFPYCVDLRNSGAVITPSLYGYAHEGMQGNAVLVGDVYRGKSYPPLYQGALFYTDYNKREIRYVAFDRRGDVRISQLVVGPVGFLTQISSDPVSQDLFMMRIGTSPENPTSTLLRLVFRGYGAGPAPGVYTLKSKAKGTCVEALGDRVETRPCEDKPSQHFRMQLLAGDAYRLIPENGELALTTSLRSMTRGDMSLDVQAEYAAQQFRAYPLREGFQLIDAASELCLTALTLEPSDALAALRCADVDQQVFELTSINNQPPVLEPIVDMEGTVGDPVLITLAARDPEGLELTYFATGLPESLSIDPQRGLVMGTLTVPGTYRVQVRVSDGQLDALREFTWSVRDNMLPDVVIDTPAPDFMFRVGSRIGFSGHATDKAGVPVPAYSLSWELYMHHNQHIHFGGLPDTRGQEGSFLAEDHGDNTAYELCLNATDGQNRVGRACRILRPVEVEYAIDSEPSGLMVTWEGVARETPFTVHTHVDGSRTVVAAPQQNGMSFVSWSDGGASTHDIKIDAVPRRLVARYQAAQ
ncbi:MAG: PQQ-dependent sugar dehydrogenase [Polyangiales bacterium]